MNTNTEMFFKEEVFQMIDRITDHERGQILNYLRICKLRVGLLLNFKHAKLEWERLAL
ncbi:MAG TPA: GxxExxY protein [Candidatus Binatia bacterium]|nr:GxxExxY protein [Candidatus Binatia bacterium]